MTAPPDTTAAEHFLVSYGKSGGLGSFSAAEPLALERGDRVIVDTPRGRELGTVLCPASVRQARLLGAVASGTIIRPVTTADDATMAEACSLSQRLFEAGRQLAQSRELSLEILDVDVFFEDRALLQFIGADIPELDTFAQTLSDSFHVDIRLENLALPQAPAEVQGCGKPDCGKTAGGGSCSTCSTGGGCSSCGSAATDLRPYFAHLREKMEVGQRTSLV
jgi:cell fate regulator YaaT (PSP1 superfamily)